jgi:Asp/Glu/hydantoin racemase
MTSQPASPTPFLGVLMLDTRFDRIMGDVANPDSYPFPVRCQVVHGADPTRVVRSGRPDDTIVNAFCEAARNLEREGATGLLTSCGFLINVQMELAASVNIPVISSALVFASATRAMHGNRPIGILTANASALDEDAIRAAGLSPGQTVVRGLEHEPAFARTFLVGHTTVPAPVNEQAIGAAAAAGAREMVESHPEIGSIVLECGNLPPYRQLIQAAANRPVIDILDAASHLWRVTNRLEPNSPVANPTAT